MTITHHITAEEEQLPAAGPVASHDAGANGAVAPDRDGETLDLLGIGYGPANLGLAIAVQEYNASVRPDHRIRAAFIEAKPEFSWHEGMLLPETDMQISFLKDLVSQRRPTSEFSFLNYLSHRGRFTDFVNLKTFFPSRGEFHDYLQWAADRVDIPVHYSHQAVSIDRHQGNYAVRIQHTDEEDSARSNSIEPATVWRAREVVLGLGIEPALPQAVSAGPRVFHNHELLRHLRELPECTHQRFVVVGSGQSAAEVTKYLHTQYPDAEIHACFRRFGYTPSDDTPYANRVFDPDAVDDFYRSPEPVKRQLLDYHWLTNYSAVDADLIEDLYRIEYEERVQCRRRLFVHRVTEVESVQETQDGVQVGLRDRTDGLQKRCEADAIIFATGFQPRDVRSLLGSSSDFNECFDGGLPAVRRDYSLRTREGVGRIFLNGGVEHSHGLSSSLLSNIAIRAAEIVNAAARQFTH